MAFVPVANTIQVDVIYLLDNQRVENTLYFESLDGWDLTSITDWIEQLRIIIADELMPLLSSSIALIELVARLLDTASSIGFSLPVTPPETGGTSGTCSPNNVTYTISLKTGLTGRSFRGRNYIPGLPVSKVNGNTIDSGLRTGLLAYFDVLKAAASENNTPLVVVSRYSGVDADGDPIPRAAGVTTPVTSVTTFDNTIDSQRRRLPGRGA